MIVSSPYPSVEIPHVSLPAYVLGRLEQYGDSIALIESETGDSVTYRELGDRIRGLAAGLQQRGLAKGDVVGIFSPNVPDYAVAFHAIALAGGIVTTANPLYTARELREQLADAGARAVFGHPEAVGTIEDAISELDIEHIIVFGRTEKHHSIDSLIVDPDSFEPVAIDPGEDLVVLPYSSGTTGLPKGVELTHRNLVANLIQVAGVLDLDLVTNEDVVLGVLPFFHIYGMLVIMNFSLSVGATVVTMSRFDLERFLALIEEHKVSRVNVVPPILVALGKHPLVDNYDTSSLLSIFSGLLLSVTIWFVKFESGLVAMCYRDTASRKPAR